MEAGKWTEPVCVADGVTRDGRRYPTWNPVLFQVPAGPLLLFYKVGPNPRQWWGMLKTSEDSGSTWSEGRRLPVGIVGPTKNKPVLMDGGRLVCPSSREGDRWRVYFDITDDMGNTWKSIGPVDSEGDISAIQPCILNHDKYVKQILSRSMSGRIVGAWSYDGGSTWGMLRPIDLPNPNSGIDALTLESGLHVLIYNHSTIGDRRWGGPRSPLNVAVSKDGRTWECILTLEESSSNNGYKTYEDLAGSSVGLDEYSYPSLVVDGDYVHISYTWRRMRIKHVVIESDILSRLL